jgi:hypothetical protein
MRWLLGLVGRLIVVGLGVWSLWVGVQLSGIGASLLDPHRDPRTLPPFHGTALSKSKAEASANVLEVMFESFGLLFLLVGGGAVIGGLFPWRLVFRNRAGPKGRQA